MNITIKKAPALHTWAFWKLYLVHMRPYLFFISGVAGLAGMTVYDQFRFDNLYNILVLLAFFFSYGFGQALTDCYQTDTDQISSPYRPLCQGLLSIRQVKLVSITGLVIITIILVFHSWVNILLCLLSVFGLWSYTYFKKHFWFAGPLYNAWIVSLLVLMGFVATAGVNKLDQIDVSVLKSMLITFLGYSNFVLIGYLKDISADQKTNYHTFPVIFGWDKSIWVADGLYVFMGIAYFTLFQHNFMSMFFGLCALIIGFSGLLYGHFTKEKIESNAAYPIISTVRAFLFIHFGLICSEMPGLWIFCLVFYLFFELIIYFRPVRMQI
jgi:4-hydroxybenzoate polyprenyltransferase